MTESDGAVRAHVHVGVIGSAVSLDVTHAREAVGIDRSGSGPHESGDAAHGYRPRPYGDGPPRRHATPAILTYPT